MKKSKRLLRGVDVRLKALEQRTYDDAKIGRAFEGARGQIAACNKRIIELQDQYMVLTSLLHNDNKVVQLEKEKAYRRVMKTRRSR